ncbi:hypothetical protein VFPFJ_07182 [Purpureocillium lilacinum]|uniref:Uncharacterized protein n=1 Tax=Purpureocillium lilacinum TaxID=33203 RepID=A0A179HES1_PURLI|nr:hypothetical protein VFPFJ_07182 [Purpureocillium lilacinum]OAQ88717.1 hypothetical protein VFPFJ_07182 [Purpureocillium lilacinum]
MLAQTCGSTGEGLGGTTGQRDCTVQRKRGHDNGRLGAIIAFVQIDGLVETLTARVLSRLSADGAFRCGMETSRESDAGQFRIEARLHATPGSPQKPGKGSVAVDGERSRPGPGSLGKTTPSCRRLPGPPNPAPLTPINLARWQDLHVSRQWVGLGPGMLTRQLGFQKVWLVDSTAPHAPGAPPGLFTSPVRTATSQTAHPILVQRNHDEFEVQDIFWTSSRPRHATVDHGLCPPRKRQRRLLDRSQVPDTGRQSSSHPATRVTGQRGPRRALRVRIVGKAASHFASWRRLPAPGSSAWGGPVHLRRPSPSPTPPTLTLSPSPPCLPPKPNTHTSFPSSPQGSTSVTNNRAQLHSSLQSPWDLSAPSLQLVLHLKSPTSEPQPDCRVTIPAPFKERQLPHHLKVLAEQPTAQSFLSLLSRGFQPQHLPSFDRHSRPRAQRGFHPTHFPRDASRGGSSWPKIAYLGRPFVAFSRCLHFSSLGCVPGTQRRAVWSCSSPVDFWSLPSSHHHRSGLCRQRIRH